MAERKTLKIEPYDESFVDEVSKNIEIRDSDSCSGSISLPLPTGTVEHPFRILFKPNGNESDLNSIRIMITDSPGHETAIKPSPEDIELLIKATRKRRPESLISDLLLANARAILESQEQEVLQEANRIRGMIKSLSL